MSSRYHSYSQHNSHIRARRACPYCTMGSIRVPDVLLELGWSDKAIEEYLGGNVSIEGLV
jgi:hypothetical protein